eukprot:364954-Chlamydomonas_euryale.AAC.5
MNSQGEWKNCSRTLEHENMHECTVCLRVKNEPYVRKWHFFYHLRVKVTGSGPTEGMPVLSVARQRGSSSRQGTITTGAPLRMVLTTSLINTFLVKHNEAQQPVYLSYTRKQTTQQAPLMFDIAALIAKMQLPCAGVELQKPQML